MTPRLRALGGESAGVVGGNAADLLDNLATGKKRKRVSPKTTSPGSGANLGLTAESLTFPRAGMEPRKGVFKRSLLQKPMGCWVLLEIHHFRGGSLVETNRHIAKLGWSNSAPGL